MCALAFDLSDDYFPFTLSLLNPRPLIHRLRPLHLIEIELQVISKSQWAKQLINNAEKNNLIAESQYGGRANKQGQSLIQKKL